MYPPLVRNKVKRACDLAEIETAGQLPAVVKKAKIELRLILFVASIGADSYVFVVSVGVDSYVFVASIDSTR